MATHTDRSWNSRQAQGDQDMSSIRDNCHVCGTSSTAGCRLQTAAKLGVSRQCPSS